MFSYNIEGVYGCFWFEQIVGFYEWMNEWMNEIQKQLPRGVHRKKLFWKYAANLHKNTHAEVWF